VRFPLYEPATQYLMYALKIPKLVCRFAHSNTCYDVTDF
jgi:hypothetical protein